MRVLKPPFVFYSETQNYTVVPKRSFVFYSEIRIFTVVPILFIGFLQRKAKFNSCT